MKIETAYGINDTVLLNNGVSRQITKVIIEITAADKIYSRYFVGDEDQVVTETDINCKLVPLRKKSKGVDNGKETNKEKNQNKKV